MVYTRPAHGDPFADSSATDATVIIDALADGLEAAESTISSHTSSIALKANIASPTFTGTAAAPTPAVATDSTTLATTAFVGLRSRVTHPNTDDVLVQVWDVANARWQVAHYDSGWRDITASAPSAVAVKVRRVGSAVTLASYNVPTTMGVAVGFKPQVPGDSQVYPANSITATGAVLWDGGTATFTTKGAAISYAGAWMVVFYVTDDAIPASLPGSLLTAAPYA